MLCCETDEAFLVAFSLKGKGDSGNKVTAMDEVLEREADSLPYGVTLPKSKR